MKLNSELQKNINKANDKGTRLKKVAGERRENRNKKANSRKAHRQLKRHK